MRNCCYQRLSSEEREEISRGLAEKLAVREIARLLERPPSTISREIRKGSCNKYTYRAQRAHKRAVRNAKTLRLDKRKLMNNTALREYVQDKLRLKWSPEQIANTLKKRYPDNNAMQISHEAIYGYLYVLPRGQLKKELLSCLRQQHKRRRKRGKKNTESTKKLEDMLSIEERPAEVADRTVPGHWEGDILIGKTGSLQWGLL